jgi:hypothetical protein
MPGNTVYLEAPSRTQDLLTIKWALRSAGDAIGSTWHEGEASTSFLASNDRWNARHVEQLLTCDSLVVICGNCDPATLELAMMAGIALARGLEVIWIGPVVRGLSEFRAVQQFHTAEDFRRQILKHRHARSMSPTEDRLAA